MTLSELYHQAGKLITAEGFENNIYSINDDTTTTIGHTIPWSDRPPLPDERQIIEHGSVEQWAALISQRRHFVNRQERLEIGNNFALTLEPRLSTSSLPTVGFHVVVAFEDGGKVVITECAPLFELFKMKDLISG